MHDISPQTKGKIHIKHQARPDFRSYRKKDASTPEVVFAESENQRRDKGAEFPANEGGFYEDTEKDSTR